MGYSQGIMQVAIEYVWIKGSRNSYLQDRRDLLKNRVWEAGVYCLERAMGISWWEWSVGSRCFSGVVQRSF